MSSGARLTRSPMRRGGRRSRATSSPRGRSTPCSLSRSEASSPRCARRRTAWRTPTTRTSCGTARAAQQQLAAARRLQADGALEVLSDRLREAAELRLKHPELSLRELAGRATPPATKAAMQRRLAKIVELGRQLNCVPAEPGIGELTGGFRVRRPPQAGRGRSSEDDLLPRRARSETRRRTGSGSTDPGARAHLRGSMRPGACFLNFRARRNPAESVEGTNKPLVRPG